MVKTIAKLAVPFTLVEEGTYPITIDGKMAEIKITYEMSKGRANEIMSMGLQSKGEGHLRMDRDHHGITQFVKAVIEFPFHIEPDIIDISKIKQTPNFQISSNVPFIKNHTAPVARQCLAYMNRLVEVVRVLTSKYWLPSLSERDIVINAIDIVNDDGTIEMVMPFLGVGLGLHLPIEIRNESSMKSAILDVLANEKDVGFFNGLILDAINYFSIGKFNEAVIVLHVGFEALIEDHLLTKLLEKGTKIEDAREAIGKVFNDKFHTVMRKHFHNIDGRDFEADEELWKRFDDARAIRKQAMHPRTRKLTEEETESTMRDIFEIVRWIIKKAE